MVHKLILLIFLLSPFSFLISGASAQEASWPMAGANPQRTSWTAEEVRGTLKPIWYRSLDAYIPRKNQLIIANDTIYVSTANGLYALNISDGSPKWIYSTQMPLGNAPTLVNGTLYVSGYDRRIHAVDAATGLLKTDWTFHQAGAGFETNPLVINNTVYAGNRDGYLYALNADSGTLKWRFKTGGPILFSAAVSKDNSTIYFASNDSYAYAVNAANGTLVWKSAKLPGAGFHSWWPVVYTEPTTDIDYVIFAGSQNYRPMDYTSEGDIGWLNFVTTQELYDLFPDRGNEDRNTLIGTRGTQPYAWASGTVTFDNTRTVNYYRDFPHRRTLFILNASTGTEYSWPDATGKPQYAPFAWAGVTHSGNRFPPVIGSDQVMYAPTLYRSDHYIGGVGIVGWKFGTPFQSLIASTWEAMDEPEAWSAGGNLLYLNLCCDRQIASFDFTRPNTTFPDVDGNRETTWFGWNLFPNEHDSAHPQGLLPGYNERYIGYNGSARFGGINGVYGDHGTTQNPPIPYKGKVYIHLGNSIIAWGNTTADPVKLSSVPAVPENQLPASTTKAELQQKLVEQVTAIISAPGLFRSGYNTTGLIQGEIGRYIGPHLVDYFHNPADTVITLLSALPHLPPDLQSQTKDYLKRWVCQYPLETIAHIGWEAGTYDKTCGGIRYTGSYGIPRETFTTPPEIADQMLDWGPFTTEDPVGWNQTRYWRFPPTSFYAMWKYSQEFGNAQANFDAIKDRFNEIPGWLPELIGYSYPPPDSVFIDYPYVLNAYIAGYQGYVELEKLAGYTLNITDSSKYSEYQRLLNLRLTTFSKDTTWTNNDWDFGMYRNAFNVARNYMFLTPELALQMRNHPNSSTQATAHLNELESVAPYWFVNQYDSTRSEATLQPLHDYQSVFLARARILNQPFEELVKYLDVPAFARGDLFYIDNLVAALEAPYAGASPTPPPRKSGDANNDGFVDGIDYVIWLNHYSQSVSGPNVGDFDSSGQVDGVDYVIWLNHYGA